MRHDTLPHNPLRVLTYQDLVSLGLYNNRTMLRRHLAAGTFPAPIQLSEHRLVWRAVEVEEFLERRTREREDLIRRWRGEGDA